MSSSTPLTPPVSGLNIAPNKKNTVVFYWDELHNKAGKERGSGRMICAAVHYDPKTHIVSYGSSVFHKESPHENFVKKSHRGTAMGRLEKCPAKFSLIFPEVEGIRELWLNKMRTDDDLFSEVIDRMFQCINDYSQKDRPIIEQIVSESHVRDHVIATLKKDVRHHIALPGGSKGERTPTTKKISL
jgi:hypothetical protein